MQNYKYFSQIYGNVLSRMYSLPMNLHKHKLYLQEQHSKSFKSWSAIIRINTDVKSFIMKSSLAFITLTKMNVKQSGLY